MENPCKRNPCISNFEGLLLAVKLCVPAARADGPTMASEQKEANASDPDAVTLGPAFEPGTWSWQEAEDWVAYDVVEANRLEWCFQAGVQRVKFGLGEDDWVDLRDMVRSDGRAVRRAAPPEAPAMPRGPRSYEASEGETEAPVAGAPPPAPWDVPLNGVGSLPPHMRNKPPDPSVVSEVGYPYWCTGSGASPELLEKLARDLEASYKEPVQGKFPDPWTYAPTEEYVPDRVEVDPIPECMKELFDESKNPVDMPSVY
jgi:hypothetical protein